jgi:hypothetical protein
MSFLDIIWFLVQGASDAIQNNDMPQNTSQAAPSVVVHQTNNFQAAAAEDK